MLHGDLKMSVLDPWKDFPFVILDGGLASELEKKGFSLDKNVWSASVLAESPSAVSDVHGAYLKAGADIITTASYQATIPGLVKYGLSEEKAADVIFDSVRLARESIMIFMDSEDYDPFMPLPLVAASAGSYGAYLADGSEYRGDYRLTEKEYHDFHRRRVEIFIEAGADIIAFETVPSYEEACAIASLMEEFGDREYWISFTVKDSEHISCGRTFADCMRMLNGRSNLAAAGINCSAPSLFTPLLESSADITDKPFIVYPNSGEMYSPVDQKWYGESRPEQIGILAHEWYGLGARIIGGCCRTGPDDTAMLYAARKSMKLRS